MLSLALPVVGTDDVKPWLAKSRCQSASCWLAVTSAPLNHHTDGAHPQNSSSSSCSSLMVKKARLASSVIAQRAGCHHIPSTNSSKPVRASVLCSRANSSASGNRVPLPNNTRPMHFPRGRRTDAALNQAFGRAGAYCHQADTHHQTR